MKTIAGNNKHQAATITSKLDTTTQQNTDNKKDNVTNSNYQAKITSGLIQTNYTQILEDMYNQSPSIDIANKLIQKLVQEHNYEKAYEYASKIELKEIDPNIMLRILLHQEQVTLTNTNSIESRKENIESYRQQGRISNDDYLWYQASIQLRYNNIEQSKILLKQITSPKYTNVIKQINDLVAKQKQQKDMPIYYTYTRIALILLHEGYDRIAQKIASEASIQNPEYILPYQILAQSYFLEQERDTSIAQLHKLKDLDPTQAQTYIQMLGIAAYNKKDYATAIIYLSQVDDPRYKNSAQQYILLSYLQAGDISNTIRTRQEHLSRDTLTDSDFYTFFYHTLFEPRVNNTIFTLYNANPSLTTQYITRCQQLLINHPVCSYGQAGYDLINNNRETASILLQQLTEKHNTSYLRETLGDYYTSIQDTQWAKQAYMNAIANQTEDKSKQIQSKILGL
jgi:hypothetical protein